MISKRITVLLIVFLLALSSCFSEVTGRAFLGGRTDHSSISISFIPKSPTAQAGSTTTDASGFYRINLKGGLYKVCFSKSGFRDLDYNSGVSVLMDENYILDPVTLEPASIKYISNTAFGTWTNDTTYVVMNNTVVPENYTLSIEPGTTIKVKDYSRIEVNGVLVAQGSSSEPILFTSMLTNAKPGSWTGLIIHSTSSVIEHCTIEYAKDAIVTSNCSPRIVSNEIRNFSSTGIDCLGGTPNLNNNFIHEFKNSDIISRGINITDATGGSVDCNMIYDGSGYGIETNSYIGISANSIHDIVGSGNSGSGNRGYAIVALTGNPSIQNNFINRCNIGVSYGGTVNGDKDPKITNNTITGNSKAIVVGNFAGGTLINNIIANNDIGIEQSTYGGTPAEISYNLLWNNRYGDFIDVKIEGIGKMVTKNDNGYDVDTYFNMIQDPMFDNNTPPKLDSKSPAYNNGHGAYSRNIGLDIYIGCLSFFTGVETEPVQTVSDTRNFPNPFRNITNIEFNLAHDSNVKIEIVDMTGRVLLTPVNESMISGPHTVQVNLPGLESGIYFYRIITRDKIETGKMTVIE